MAQLKAVLLGGALFTAAVVTGCSGAGDEKAPVTSTVTVSTTQAPSAGAPSAPPSTTVSMMPNPNGDGSMVPCEGTICTNPNHGAGEDPADNGEADAPPEPGQTEFEGPGA